MSALCIKYIYFDISASEIMINLCKDEQKSVATTRESHKTPETEYQIHQADIASQSKKGKRRERPGPETHIS
jgi:hypothetical protein